MANLFEMIGPSIGIAGGSESPTMWDILQRRREEKGLEAQPFLPGGSLTLADLLPGLPARPAPGQPGPQIEVPTAQPPAGITTPAQAGVPAPSAPTAPTAQQAVQAGQQQRTQSTIDYQAKLNAVIEAIEESNKRGKWGNKWLDSLGVSPAQAALFGLGAFATRGMSTDRAWSTTMSIMDLPNKFNQAKQEAISRELQALQTAAGIEGKATEQAEAQRIRGVMQEQRATGKPLTRANVADLLLQGMPATVGNQLLDALDAGKKAQILQRPGQAAQVIVEDPAAPGGIRAIDIAGATRPTEAAGTGGSFAAQTAALRSVVAGRISPDQLPSWMIGLGVDPRNPAATARAILADMEGSRVLNIPQGAVVATRDAEGNLVYYDQSGRALNAPAPAGGPVVQGVPSMQPGQPGQAPGQRPIQGVTQGPPAPINPRSLSEVEVKDLNALRNMSDYSKRLHDTYLTSIASRPGKKELPGSVRAWMSAAVIANQTESWGLKPVGELVNDVAQRRPSMTKQDLEFLGTLLEADRYARGGMQDVGNLAISERERFRGILGRPTDRPEVFMQKMQNFYKFAGGNYNRHVANRQREFDIREFPPLPEAEQVFGGGGPQQSSQQLHEQQRRDREQLRKQTEGAGLTSPSLGHQLPSGARVQPRR